MVLEKCTVVGKHEMPIQGLVDFVYELCNYKGWANRCRRNMIGVMKETGLIDRYGGYLPACNENESKNSSCFSMGLEKGWALFI